MVTHSRLCNNLRFGYASLLLDWHRSRYDPLLSGHRGELEGELSNYEKHYYGINVIISTW